MRVGEPGRLSLFGLSLSREELIPGDIVIVTDSGLIPLSGTALTDRYTERRAARLNFLWGVRNVRFKRVAGFDALTGEQDVRTGFQFGTLFGRSLSVLRTPDDDILVSADIYAGAGTARSFAAIQFLGEGRQSYDENRWDDILTSGRAAWYFKTHPRHGASAPLFSSGSAKREGACAGIRTRSSPGGNARSRGSSSDGCSATCVGTRMLAWRCSRKPAACGRAMYRSEKQRR
jgi:hypothetical protein